MVIYSLIRLENLIYKNNDGWNELRQWEIREIIKNETRYPNDLHPQISFINFFLLFI